ncbi:DNA polymerase Y family protein [Brevibacterium litoralis]|uniref:DNA polymerase Y family protein n=1 Tax=Brevibacterium litoralis TaxID=3138935 RepID=UPI0032EB3DA5
MTRTLVLAVPDWPTVAAVRALGLDPLAPVAILRAGRIRACNGPARAAGVGIGLNKRAAQLRCPDLQVLSQDTDRDHRVFAEGIGVLESLVARFSLVEPGVVSMPVTSLQHTHADEAAATEHLLTGLTDATGWEFFPGVADTGFGALLASRTATRVPPGATAEFLAPLPSTVLEEVDPVSFGELVPLLERLGLRTLGTLAALPESEVSGRFGEVGTRAHRLAAGHEDRIPVDHVRAREHRVEVAVDPPTGRSDVLSFHARSLAGDLFRGVRADGLVCTHVSIGLLSTTGEEQTRTWRIEEMSETAVADRLRWQSEGWLRPARGRGGAPGAGRSPEAGGPAPVGGGPGRSGRPPQVPGQGSLLEGDGADPGEPAEDGIALITLVAAELVAPLRTQESLFDQRPGRIAHTLERIQGLYGAETVLVPSLQGGRDPDETALWTPWQQAPRAVRDPGAPWPGDIPAPRPTLVERTPVDLLDAQGVSVVARPAGLDAAPALLRAPASGGRPRFSARVTAWSGSWPVESGWWDEAVAQYRVRIQVVTEDGHAFLLCKEEGEWYLVGRYE